MKRVIMVILLSLLAACMAPAENDCPDRGGGIGGTGGCTQVDAV